MPSDPPPATRQELADQLVPLAAELVGTVRDYGPDEVAAILARVPDRRHDALAVVLAAMVDPDATTHQLLRWLDHPVQSRPFQPARRGAAPCPICGLEMRKTSMSRHVTAQHSVRAA